MTGVLLLSFDGIVHYATNGRGTRVLAILQKQTATPDTLASICKNSVLVNGPDRSPLTD